MIIHSHSAVSAITRLADSVTARKPQADQSARDGVEQTPAGQSGPVEARLSQDELRVLRELKARDLEVRAHERAHAAAAGSLVRSGPSYDYQRGPDGRLYAVGGEVQIDTSPVPGDPEATLQKAQKIQRAALAPAEPSAQDQAVAAQAVAMAVEARVEIARERSEDKKMDDKQGVQTLQSEERVDEVGHTHVICAICGGKHSVEGHSAATAYQAADLAVKPERSGSRLEASA